MNIFKAIGTITTSATSVIVKSCTAMETLADSLDDVAQMSKSTTEGMLNEMRVEQAASLAALKKTLK